MADKGPSPMRHPARQDVIGREEVFQGDIMLSTSLLRFFQRDSTHCLLGELASGKKG